MRNPRKSIDSGSGKRGQGKYTKHVHLDQATRIAWARRVAAERERAQALNGPVTVRRIGDPPD
jgi:hypothetical protein